METLDTFLHAHWQAILTVLGVWFAIGNTLAKRWPMPPATAPSWKRVAHFLLVNLPVMGRALEGRTIWGFTFSIPFLAWTLRPDDEATAPPRGPTNGQSGRTSLDVILWLALLIGLGGVALASSGCATCNDMGNATCARKALTAIDALDGAASRVGGVWIRKCAESAKTLYEAGNSDAAEAAFNKCEQTGTILVLSVKEVEDGAGASAGAVDVAEKIGAKDYNAALAPALSAARALYKNFTDAGLSLPALDALLGVK